MKPHPTVVPELKTDPLGDVLADCYGFLLYRLSKSQASARSAHTEETTASTDSKMALTAGTEVDHLYSMPQALS